MTERVNNVEKIKSLVGYILAHLPEKYRGITRIIKLLYLIDWLYYTQYGHTYTGTKWVFYHYGPFSEEIYHILDKKDERTSDGRKWKIVNIPSNSKKQNDHFDEQIKDIVNYVIKKFSRKSLDELLEFVYSTPPMRQASKGDTLL